MYFYFNSTKLIFFNVLIIEIIIVMSTGPRPTTGALARGGLIRTIGGRDARPGEFQYVVRLEMQVPEIVIDGILQYRAENVHRCTASVLTQIVTLTAAHCYVPEIQYSYVIRYGLGDSRPTNSDKFSNVLEWVFLPSSRKQYSTTIMLDDVALLKTEPIVLDSYARISARDRHTMNGQSVFILGYGYTNHSNGYLYDTLDLRMPLQVVDAMLSQCDETEYLYPIMCAVERCGHHAAVCDGDSGGPLVHASGIVGIVYGAYDENCQMKRDDIRDNVISVNIPLSIYIDWIGDIITKMMTL